MPQNIKKDIKVELEKMKKMSTFSEAKEFKKRDWKKVIPPIAAEPGIVEAFNQEAKIKKWSKTTLMNEILKERYGKETTDRVKYSVGIKFPKTKKKIDIKFYLF